jgi:hypothetical protein
MKKRRLNTTQLGAAAQLRFAMLAIVGSGGTLELVPPIADDEGRDFELHLRHRFGPPLSIQIKVRAVRGRHRLLEINFGHARRRTDRAYWYFAAYFDPAVLDFVDPLFLIPSTALHRAGRPIIKAGISLKPGSRDQWVRFRTNRASLGRRLVAILHGLEKSPRRYTL